MGAGIMLALHLIREIAMGQEDRMTDRLVQLLKAARDIENSLVEPDTTSLHTSSGSAVL